MQENQQATTTAVDVSPRVRSRVELDPESANSAKIMIIDDESVMIKFLRKYLKDAGYGNCIGITESPEAMAIIRRERPDVILLDFEMPKVDGLEILEMVRGDGCLRHIPVLMMTVCTDADIKLRALELGATDFLSKPLDSNELIPRVRNTLVTKSYQDDLVKLNTTLEAKVDEQTAALREAYAELKDLDRLKYEFLTLVSHELRTPLTLWMGYVSLLDEDLLQDQEERAQAILAIKQSGERLLHITQDVERILSLTAGEVNLNITTSDLHALLRTVEEEWRDRVEEKGISFVVETPESLMAHTIHSMVSDCLERLLDNALKFTNQGNITVSLLERDGRAELKVTDTGSGIEPRHQARVLTPLAVADDIVRHTEGCGLGLAIVKREAEILGGEISFASPGVDQGASFFLVIPLDIREHPSEIRIPDERGQRNGTA